MKLAPPPVKERAMALGIPVEQPSTVRSRAFVDHLRALDADVAVVTAYGKILPPAVLTAPRLGCVNVHASLLPRFRGAAPIQWAVAAGDAETGVCLMQMDEGMDTGPVLAASRTPIGPGETAGALAVRLAALGGDLLRSELPRLLAGELTPTPQDDSAATYARMLVKDDGRVDFRRSAREVDAHVRGMSPWPGAFAVVDGTPIKLHEVRVRREDGAHGPPGRVLSADRHGIDVACGEGIVTLREVQLPGRRRVTAAELHAGGGLPGSAFAVSEA
jgi:methionyl-tRNA formyltransferase